MPESGEKLLRTEMGRGVSKPRRILGTHPLILTSTLQGRGYFKLCLKEVFLLGWKGSLGSYPWGFLTAVPSFLTFFQPCSSRMETPSHWETKAMKILPRRKLLFQAWRKRKGKCDMDCTCLCSHANSYQDFPSSCSQCWCFSSSFKTPDVPGRHPKVIPLMMSPEDSLMCLFIWLFFCSTISVAEMFLECLICDTMLGLW